MSQRIPDSNRSNARSSPGAPTAPVNRPPPVSPPVPDHELLRLIGSGAYGEVWLARSVTGAFRAVKVVSRRRFDDERPFEREFKGIQTFEPVSRRHASQLAILHVGRRDDYFYYIMELADDAEANVESNPELRVESPQKAESSSQPSTQSPRNFSAATYRPRTLKSELQKRGRLSADECLRVALSLTTALEHLHEHGLIHRDIKPSNIIFVGGVPKLADIGLVTDSDATLSFVGTEGFVPPEGPGTIQADIFSLGKVLYEMGTGRDRQEFPELPTALRESPDREAVVEMNEVILKACEPDPRKRYQAAAEMHADLALLQAGRSLRRARGLEMQLRLFSKVAAGAGVILAITAAAWVYQRQQTREARYWAEQSRQRLVRLHNTQGLQKIEEGDLIGSLPWLLEALKLDQGSTQEDAHRFRLGGVLRQAANITAFWHTPETADRIEASPDQRLVLAVHDRTVGMWDLETGESRPTASESRLKSVGRSVPAEPNEEELRNTLRRLARDGLALPGALRNQSAAGRSDPAEPNKEQSRNRFAARRDGLALPTELRNSMSAEPRAPPFEHLGKVLWAEFSPQSDRIVTTSEQGEAFVWDVRTGRKVCTLQQENVIAQQALFSPDGKRVATAGTHGDANRGQARMWDADSGQPLTAEMEFDGVIQNLRFSPNARYLATSSKQPFGFQVRIWESATGRPMSGPFRYGGVLPAVQFSPDSRSLCLGTGGIEVLDISTGQSRRLLPGETGADVMCFNSNGTFLAATSEGVALVSEFSTGKAVGPTVSHKRPIRSVGFSPDSRYLVTASDDFTARIWHIRSGRLAQPPLQHESKLRGAAFGRDGRAVVTLAEQSVRIWDSSLTPPILRTFLHQEPGTDAKFSPDTRQILSASSRTGQFWDTATGRSIGPTLAHDHAIATVAFSPDGRLAATASADGTARIWDAQTGLAVGSPLGHNGPVEHVMFHPIKPKLLTASGTTVRVWKVPDGAPLGPALDLSNRVTAVIWQPAGDTCVVACEPRPGRSEILTLRTDPAPVLIESKHWPEKIIRLLPGPDAVLLASTADDYTVRVWDNTSGLPVSPPLKHEHPVVHFAANARLTKAAIVGTDRNVRLWDLKSGEMIFPRLEHPFGITRAEFSPDEGRLVTVSQEGLVRVWELAPERRSIREIELLSSLLAAREIDASGTTVVVGPTRLAETWRRLKSGSTLPTPSTHLAAAWHRHEADNCEAMAAWRERPEFRQAALFHRALVWSLEPVTPEDLLLRAVAHARMNDWQQAKSDYQQALSLGAEPDYISPDQVLLQMMTGDKAGYQKSCRQLLARFAETQNPEQANDVAWLCCLVSDALPSYNLPVRMMRQAARLRPTQNNIFNTFGAALYRAGAFEEAIRTLQQGIGFFPGEGTTFDFVYLALAHHALGHVADARVFLEKTVRSIDATDPDRKWKWEVELKLLRAEAEAQIGSSSH